MDPERASMLVAKLLEDVVPGKLAVIRLLDLVADANLIPTKSTGQTGPCSEDPSKTCNLQEFTEDHFPRVRRDKVAALIQDAKGSASFKESLNGHLEQKANNSMLDFALAAAAGVFDENRARSPDAPRTLIWLSDGDVPDSSKQKAKALLSELRTQGVDIRAIVFGRGQTAFAEANGLPVLRSAGPSKLVEAFTDVFRQIVQAPYKIHAPVSSQPAFEMKQHIDEAWVIVYGDKTPVISSSIRNPVLFPQAARDVWPSAEPTGGTFRSPRQRLRACSWRQAGCDLRCGATVVAIGALLAARLKSHRGFVPRRRRLRRPPTACQSPQRRLANR
jgi:hypothetical protein